MRVKPVFLITLIFILSSNSISRAAEPWPAASCEKLAEAILNATKIPVSISIEKIVSDYEVGIIPDGCACIIRGRASGLDQPYFEVYRRARAISSGWTAITEVEADGAASSTWGARKGPQELVIHLDSDPPASCDDGPVGYCKAPLKMWTWTIRAMAYQR